MNKMTTLRKGMLFKVENTVSRIYEAVSTDGVAFEDEIDYNLRVSAYEKGYRIYYDGEKFDIVDNDFIPTLDIENMNLIDLIHSSYDIKPANIIMKKTNWKFLVRNVVKGKNILMTGPSGTGKSKIAWIVSKVLKKPFHKFNLGATQDPRATLIGNTFFSPENGTFHSPSEFVKAIQTENAVILLDELSRAHPEAWNILMTVLDPGQRYLRLDEANGQKTINVAKGVSFIATANIGTNYTSTRTLDRALKDRFVNIEMPQLSSSEENELLMIEMPKLKEEYYNDKITMLCKITESVRSLHSDGEISEHFSTRMVLEVGEMLLDGFKLGEALEVTMLPLYDSDGGENSERNKVLICLQKNLHSEENDNKNLYGDNLLDDSDLEDENPFTTKKKY